MTYLDPVLVHQPSGYYRLLSPINTLTVQLYACLYGVHVFTKRFQMLKLLDVEDNYILLLSSAGMENYY